MFSEQAVATDTHMHTGGEASCQDLVPAVLEDPVVGPAYKGFYSFPVASHKPGWLGRGGGDNPRLSDMTTRKTAQGLIRPVTAESIS